MQKFLIFQLLISGLCKELAHAADPASRQLACQRVEYWCSGCQGVNITQLTEMISHELREAIREENPDAGENRICRGDTTGTLYVNIPGIGEKRVYCDETTDGGNWIVLQRRMNRQTNFNRYWNDYVHGFGELNGNFWLGLEALHQLTKSGNHELRFDMTRRDGTHLYAKYSDFKVGSASDNYTLSVSGYSGNATDSFADPPSSNLAALNGMKFTTRDRENDEWVGGNCAVRNKGGWWFNSCYYGFLNGRYNDMKWYDQTWGRFMYMRYTEMKFRKIQ